MYIRTKFSSIWILFCAVLLTVVLPCKYWKLFIRYYMSSRRFLGVQRNAKICKVKVLAVALAPHASLRSWMRRCNSWQLKDVKDGSLIGHYETQLREQLNDSNELFGHRLQGCQHKSFVEKTEFLGNLMENIRNRSPLTARVECCVGFWSTRHARTFNRSTTWVADIRRWKNRNTSWAVREM